MPRRRRHHEFGLPAQPPSQRQLRVGEELRHALAQLLRPGELRDPALQEASVTVTEVRMSPDLRNASAFVIPLAGTRADEVMAGLERSAGFLKARIGRSLGLRHTPSLVFAFDRAFESAERIATLLADHAVERDLHPSDAEDENGD
ncbi:MAG TPA: 30S ribosome-binding factor RbfA [Stellaceae bacterium]|jgi:ribosome-binding factor A|nr:30S ribosome-binding factor RbfA [Stellaceae bacterium]